jgi:dihydrofolate reductase
VILAIIVAHDPQLVIGKGGSLPWHYSEDLRYFKRTTMGHALLMGRVVFESLDKKPLPGRKNIVLSRSQNFEQVPTFSAIDDALASLQNEEIIFCIGGGSVYRQVLPITDKLFVTEIHQKYEGDTRFPEYRDEIGFIWREIKRDDRQSLSFVVYERMR